MALVPPDPGPFSHPYYFFSGLELCDMSGTPNPETLLLLAADRESLGRGCRALQHPQACWHSGLGLGLQVGSCPNVFYEVPSK